MTVIFLSVVGMVSVGLAAYFIGYNKGYSNACEEMVALSNKISQTLKLKSELLASDKYRDYEEAKNKNQLN